MSDQAFMARAIQLAHKGLYTTHPNPRVGCVIVQSGELVGDGFHALAGQGHAEVLALQQAGDRARGATVYVTLEPCSHHGRTPPCADALIKAGVSRVVVAMQDPNPRVAGEGIRRLREAGIQVDVGVLEQSARALNPGFIKRMETGLPWLRVKLAMSLDGRTAMASGESAWITGPEARADVQKLRARASAVLSGSETVLQDNPSLNLRLTAAELGIETEPRQPMRVILDTSLRVPRDARLFSLPGEVVVITSSTVPDDYPARVVQLGSREGRVNLTAALQWLAQQEINEVHVEAGATLSGALMAEGLVDELVVYMAPHLMGDTGKGLLHLPDIQAMNQRLPLKINDIRAVGNDWRISASISK